MIVTDLKTSFWSTVDVLKATSVDKLPNDLEGMELTMERLLTLINDVYKYVDSVVVSLWYPWLSIIDHRYMIFDTEF